MDYTHVVTVKGKLNKTICPLLFICAIYQLIVGGCPSVALCLMKGCSIEANELLFETASIPYKNIL
jgi:hypothetical protein